jgi:hypothetical protein
MLKCAERNNKAVEGETADTCQKQANTQQRRWFT